MPGTATVGGPPAEAEKVASTPEIMKERLQKILARAGIASRRKAEELIRQGRVTVNGRVPELGAKADPRSDHVKVDGRRIRLEPLEYWVVNKPQGVLSSVRDDRSRPVVTGLVPSERRLFPAGRLDFQSEGLMILTNDGELARAVTRSGHLEKVYLVKVRGRPEKERLQRLRSGLLVGGERYAPCRVRPLKQDRNSWFEVVLKEGRNRQIRRMFEAIGHPVMRLRRVAVGMVKLGDLPPGGCRPLSPAELKSLLRR